MTQPPPPTNAPDGLPPQPASLPPRPRGRIAPLAMVAVIATITTALAITFGVLFAGKSSDADQATDRANEATSALDKANGELGEFRRQDQSRAVEARCDKIAGDFAGNAATVDYRSVPQWIGQMKAAVNDELKRKYDNIAPSFQQLIGPLKLEVTGKTLAARTTERSQTSCTTLAFVQISSKNTQQPQAVVSTVTYTVKIDTGSWLITEVGDPAGTLPK